MYSEDFSLRLSQLRIRKGVSARDMSLSLGQNPAYINNIESGKALPSMTSFFYICEYLGISPKDFFDDESKDPEKKNGIVANLEKLTDTQLDIVSMLIRELARK